MTITAYDREIANGINLALYGETFEMMQERLKKVAKEAGKEAAEKTALQIKIQTIRNLYFQAKMNKTDIAVVMNVLVDFVDKVIEER